LTPVSDIAAKTPAWVCAPGVLKVPFLDVFLNDYDLRRLPGDQVQAVLGWGLKPTAAAGRRWAEANARPYVALEDGFLRSVGLGEAGAASLSLIVEADGGCDCFGRRPRAQPPPPPREEARRSPSPNGGGFRSSAS
jgi:capsular polysaccharide export protein